MLGGETAVDFIALDAEKEKLLLENLALKEGLSSVEQKVSEAVEKINELFLNLLSSPFQVRQARSRSRGGSRSGSDVEGSDDRMNQSGTSRGTRTASVSSSVSDEDVVLASQVRESLKQVKIECLNLPRFPSPSQGAPRCNTQCSRGGVR